VDENIPMDIFISHSSKDADFVYSLVRLFVIALGMEERKIICTSVEETQLRGGEKIEDSLKQKVIDSKVFVAVISAASLDSTYVLFELGARWGSSKKIIPLILPNVDEKQIDSPLKTFSFLTCNREGLNKLIEDVGEALGLEIKSPGFVRDEIEHLLRFTHKSAMITPVAYAVLSYVIDNKFNFALLKDPFYKKIQPPGRTLQPNEYPHEIALRIAHEELSLPIEELQRIPKFDYSSHGKTWLVPPPYQVQAEEHYHRTALVHYDFVYVFYIDREKPPLSVRASGQHKIEPDWLSIEEVENLQDGQEFGPHKDMIPTMKRIKNDFSKNQKQ
jgi:hypothetical protein